MRDANRPAVSKTNIGRSIALAKACWLRQPFGKLSTLRHAYDEPTIFNTAEENTSITAACSAFPNQRSRPTTMSQSRIEENKNGRFIIRAGDALTNTGAGVPQPPLVMGANGTILRLSKRAIARTACVRCLMSLSLPRILWRLSSYPTSFALVTAP